MWESNGDGGCLVGKDKHYAAIPSSVTSKSAAACARLGRQRNRADVPCATACGAGQPEAARARAVLKAAVMLALVVRASLVEFFTCNISGDQIVWVEI
jgi:hypothetical protein